MTIEQARHFQLLIGLIVVFLSACSALKINSVSVPSSYELKDGGGPIILDCDFSVDENEIGFFLKWMQNSVAIYQWLPSKKVPIAMGAFKGRLDLNYVSSEDSKKKHSSLVIKDPLLRDSGNYTCVVQTFQGRDTKSAVMLVYVPADSIKLTYSIDEVKDEVNVKCEVHQISPIPEVKLLFNSEGKNVLTIIHTRRSGDDANNKQYDAIISSILPKNSIQDSTSITCLVKIANSDYEQTETIIYVDPAQAIITDNVVEISEDSSITDRNYEVVDSTIGKV